MTKTVFTDYKERLEKARATLHAMKEAASKDRHLSTEEIRLGGKAEGVALALSYLREYEKELNDGN